MKYAYIKQHQERYRTRTLCQMPGVHPSGFYAWMKHSLSRRAKEDARQTDLIRQAWEDSGKVYGYRKLQDDLLDQALLMAVWRRKPKGTVLIHSDQGTQFTSMEWTSFLKAHNLEHSMSRRGNCHDNAVAESFFNLLERERVRRRTYQTRGHARQDVFDYIEVF